MPDPREAKLPRWAQDELAKERAKARYAERQLAEHKATVPQSRLWHGDYDNPIYLPDCNTVHWQLYGGDRLFDQIQVRMDGGALEVTGGHAIAIEPNSSNFVHIRLRD